MPICDYTINSNVHLGACHHAEKVYESLLQDLGQGLIYITTSRAVL